MLDWLIRIWRETLIDEDKRCNERKHELSLENLELLMGIEELLYFSAG